MSVLSGPDAKVEDQPRVSPSWLDHVHGWVVTVDHKRLGIMYILSGLVFFLAGGLEAAAVRVQLAVPGNDFLGPILYNQMFTMHGTTMVFLVGMPVLLGFGNLLVPLMRCESTYEIQYLRDETNRACLG